MTAPSITPATGAHAASTGAAKATRHHSFAPQWTRELAAAGGEAAEPSATTTKDAINGRLAAPNAARTDTVSGTSVLSTANPSQHEHRAAAAPAQTGPRGTDVHKHKDASNTGAAAMVSMALSAAPVMNGKTSAARDVSGAPRKLSAESEEGARQPAEDAPAAVQASQTPGGVNQPSATGPAKPSARTGETFNTVETSSVPFTPPPATFSTASLVAGNLNAVRAPSVANATPVQAVPAVQAVQQSDAKPKQEAALPLAKFFAGVTAPASPAPQAGVNGSAATLAAMPATEAAIAMTGTQAAPPANAPMASSAGDTVPPTPSALAATILAMQKNGESSAVLHLAPAGLGTLTVHVSLAAGALVNVQFLPATPQAAHIINNNLDDLRQAMTAAGLSPGQAFVGTGDGQSGGGFGNSQQPRQGRDYAEPQAAPKNASTVSEPTPAGLSTYA